MPASAPFQAGKPALASFSISFAPSANGGAAGDGELRSRSGQLLATGRLQNSHAFIESEAGKLG